MNKVRLIGSAVLALGLMSAVPSLANADDRRWDRGRDDWRDRREVRYDRDYRDDHRHYSRDFDIDVPLSRVPRDVLRTVDRETRGRRIESVQYVSRDGKLFYRVRVDDPGRHDHDVNIRVQPGGRLLSIEEAERWDVHYHRPGYAQGYRR